MGLALSLIATLFVPQIAPPPQHPAYEPARQVQWQHTLEDALELAQTEGRGLLVAVNADGESASEAIVRERYRDPEWVANTRPFVCVVASVFRHSVQDYDADGRRVPCPRLGEVTCGEHIALEPLVHAELLAGAEIDLFGEQVGRISPRHALITPEGEKAFDLFLLFDLGELDRAIADAAAGLAPRAEVRLPKAGELSDQATLRVLAARRDGAARGFLERWLQEAPAEALWAATTALVHAGNAGSLGALRVLVARAERPALIDRIAYAASVLGLEREVADAIRARLFRLPDTEHFDWASDPASARWLEALCGLDPEHPTTRDIALTFIVFGGPGEHRAAVRSAAALGLGDVPAAVEAAGGAFDLDAFLARAGDDRSPIPGEAEPELPTADELIATLEELGRELEARPGDPALRAELGRGMLGLARRRIDAGGAGGGIPFLLEDARDNLLAATRAMPGDASLWLDLARIAYYRADFDVQEESARTALAALSYEPGSPATDARTADGVRWLGDAIARRLGEYADAPPEERAAALARGAHALAAAATGHGEDATDWLSLASFCNANGRPVAAARVLLEGLHRYPESDPLRALFGRLVATRPVLLSVTYHQLASLNPDSGSCAWYAGWADVLLAEQQRRAELPALSVQAYESAARAFRRALELNETYRESSEFFLARCALGRGFAHLLADEREAAAAALVDAARWREDAAYIVDDLAREAVDLVDGVLELRRSGPSPVDALAWLDQLAEVDADNDAWPRMVSDAELRESVRAISRGEPAVGESYARVAVEAARRAVALQASEQNGKALAQPATVLAELLLDPAEPEASALVEAEALILEAAAHLTLSAPPISGDLASLRTAAAELRAGLGEARPVVRPGR